jgi:intergrase/recombinase
VRTGEGILCLRKIRELGLDKYPMNECGILEHWRHRETFLRRSKKLYISVLTDNLIEQLRHWNGSITYKRMRGAVQRAGAMADFYRLRKWHCTILRCNGIPSEIVDILEGRCPSSILGRSYMRPDFRQLMDAVKNVLEPYAQRWLEK